MTKQTTEDRQKGLADKLDKVKDEIKALFEELGLGKDVLLRVHGAIDTAQAAVLSVGERQAHDLNDELAESPEDHPREQGQGKRPPINTDDTINNASPKGDVEPVVSGSKVS